MPTYDYECTVCGHTFEKFQAISARPVRSCPVCGRRKVRRLIGAGAGVIFKGSGFYQTDYRSESYRKAAENETKGQAASETGEKGPGGSAKVGRGDAAEAPAPKAKADGRPKPSAVA